MAKIHNKSTNRTDYRSVRDKFNEASKALSIHMSNSRTDVSEKVLYGYEMNAGEFIARNSENYQLQLKVVRAKKCFIKKPGVIPIFAKWAIGVKIRIYLTGLMNKIFQD